MRRKSSDLGNLQDSVVLDRARLLCTFMRFIFSMDYLGIPRIAIIPKRFEKTRSHNQVNLSALLARCAVVVAAWTGLSLAELRGLKWAAIDFDKSQAPAEKS